MLELSSLFEISRTLNASLELSHILNNILLIPMGRLLVARGVILLIRNDHCRVETAKGIRETRHSLTFPAVSLPGLPTRVPAIRRSV